MTRRERFRVLSFLVLLALGWAAAVGARDVGVRQEWEKQIDQALRFARAGAFEKAIGQAEAARDGADGSLKAATENVLGWIYELNGKPTEAVDAYERALALFEELGDVTGQGTVNNNLIRAHAAAGQERGPDWQRHYEEAEKHYRQTVEFLGRENALTAVANRNLSAMYGERGEVDRAIDHAAEAVRVVEGIDDTSPARLAFYLDELAHWLETAERFAEAAERYERALGIRNEVLEPGDAAIAESFLNLGRIACLRGNSENAVSFLGRAYGMLRQNREEPTLERVLLVANLAFLMEQKAVRSKDERNRERLRAESAELWRQAVGRLPSFLPEVKPPLVVDAVLKDLVAGAGRCGRLAGDADAILPAYVAERQRRLSALLGRPLGDDGIAGTGTTDAIRDFLAAVGLEQGVLDVEADAALAELAGHRLYVDFHGDVVAIGGSSPAEARALWLVGGLPELRKVFFAPGVELACRITEELAPRPPAQEPPIEPRTDELQTLRCRLELESGAWQAAITVSPEQLKAAFRWLGSEEGRGPSLALLLARDDLGPEPWVDAWIAYGEADDPDLPPPEERLRLIVRPPPAGHAGRR